MRYVKPFTTNVAMLDQPRTKNDHSYAGVSVGTKKIKREMSAPVPISEIFEYLLVYDQSTEQDRSSVLDEALVTLGAADPGFESSTSSVFRKFIESPSHVAKWNKVKQDYGFYIQSESKRRNRENPYHSSRAEQAESWEDLPDFTRQKRNQPWQFDYMYRDAQFLIGELYELTRNARDIGDGDFFRVKVNGILVPDKLIFALNTGDAFYDFGDMAINIINTKLSLDGYRLAQTFLARAVESMKKISAARSSQHDFDAQVSSAQNLSQKIGERALETERRFMLLMGALYDEA